MDQKLTLVEHLSELRKRIIISLVVFGIASVVSFPFASIFLKILKLPAQGLIDRLVFFSPQDAFLIYMHIAFVSGLVISIPVILYQVWAFIKPAIGERYKRYATYFIVFSLVSFIIGCLFVYFILTPPALKFLLGFARNDLEPVISVQKYVSFITSLILAGGIVFQMPVLSLILAKVGIINSSFLRKKYKYAIVIIFIVAAIITPTGDIFNMLILAGPMLFLYEISIWVAHLAKSSSSYSNEVTTIDLKTIDKEK